MSDKVSVIIPCYNHEQYVSIAIESVLSQRYEHIEIIVVDDGSTDNSKEIVDKYPQVKYIYQNNQGPSYARNRGIDHCTGEYIVFLDADDWLLEDALSINAHYLQQNKEAAFVSGAFKLFYESENFFDEDIRVVEGNHYNKLLEGNYIGMIATVMFHSWVLNNFRFDVSLRSCEDYDLFLNIARKYKVIHHTQFVAIYRIHSYNTSYHIPNMLKGSLTVLNRQKKKLLDSNEKRSFLKGLKFWKHYYSEIIFKKLLLTLEEDSINDEGYLYTLEGGSINNEENLYTLWKYDKSLFYKYMKAKAIYFKTKGWLVGWVYCKTFIKNRLPPFMGRWLHKMGVYNNLIPEIGEIKWGDFDRTVPFSKEFGYDRGGPVDRYYIENFLLKMSPHIKGRVLEIGDNDYTLRFGENRITQSDILHVDESNPNATYIGDLTDAPHIPDEIFDCIILTETIHLIYNYKQALATCFRILKPGGVLLLTVPGISHIDHDEWKEHWMWSFTDTSLIRVLSEIFPRENVTVETFGNVMVATAFLYGLGLPEMKKSQMDETDPHYQVKITAIAVKPI